MNSFRKVLLFAMLLVGLAWSASAQLLFIHNSPDTLLANVTVQVGGTSPVNVTFSQSTLLGVGTGEQEIIVRNTSNNSIILQESYDFSTTGLHHAYFTGLSGTDGYLENPSGAPVGLKLSITPLSALPQPSTEQVRVIFVHGSTDLPDVKIGTFPGQVIVDDLKHGNFEVALLPAADNNLNILSPDSVLLLGTYRLPLVGRNSQTVVVLLSGFLSPVNNGNGARFTTRLLVPGINTSQALSNVTRTQENIFSELRLFPNPNQGTFEVRWTVDSAIDYSAVVRDISGREVYRRAGQWAAQGLNTLKMELSNTPAGMYLLTLENSGQMQTVPFFVK